MLKFIKKNKKYFLLVSMLLIVGLLCGIIYYFFLNKDTLELVANSFKNYNNFRYNSIFKDLIIMSLLFIFSIFIIGVPLSLFYLFYESFSLGFLISLFIINFKIKGLIYILIYIIINKLFVLILMILYIKRIINISRYIIGFIIYKKDDLIKNKLFNSLYTSIYYIIFVLIFNILLYFITPSIFSNLSNLLK